MVHRQKIVLQTVQGNLKQMGLLQFKMRNFLIKNKEDAKDALLH
jgi:hypothetical protein